MIDPTFRNINRLFPLFFRIGRDSPTINYMHYMLSVKIKDFNVLIENKPFMTNP